MSITFYRNNSDNNVMDKNISEIGSINGTFRENCSIIDPVFTIEDFGSFNPATANYCYISSFGRYYYINNIVVISNKIYEVHCHVDVLMSFKSGIRANSAVISRQENKSNANLYLQDGAFKQLSNPNYNIIKFPNGFGNQHFILVVAGS